MKILVFGVSPLPFERKVKLYGANIRTWNIIKPLLDDGHEVVLVGLRLDDRYEQGKTAFRAQELKRDNFTYYSLRKDLFDDLNFLQKIHDRFNPGCVLGLNNVPCLSASLINTDKPIWADLNGSLLAEAQAKAYVYDNDTYLTDLMAYERIILKRADIFSVCSLPQKFALIGELGLLGRLNKYTFGYELIRVIPNSIDKIPYSHKEKRLRGIEVQDDDFVVLYSGSYNTWTDTQTLFSALEASMAKNPKIKFVSLGGAVPGHDEKTYFDFLRKVEKSRFSSRFILKGWVEAQELPDYYLESDIGINVDSSNYETLLGARNRILDMFKAGLAVVCSLGTEISHLIKEQELGFTYPLEDSLELSRLILFCSQNKQLTRSRGSQAKNYVFTNLTSDKTAYPLREWVKCPEAAKDRGKIASLPQDYSRAKFRRYLGYIRAQGFSAANRRAWQFFVNKVKR
jgi:glycosyltransferase involved in cell wall biosynthesis